MNKSFHNFAWRNYPDDNTPLNESNLNKVNNAIDEIDNRVLVLDDTKATKAEVASLVKEISFNEATGVFTVTRKNNTIFTIDTKLEKIAVNFTYNSASQQIILTLIDGTKQYIDLSALITEYEFLDSDTINFQLQADGKVTAIVKEGSIEEKHLRPDYLAEIKVEAAKAQAGAADSFDYAKQSQSYAVGTGSVRPNESTDSAKYYYEQSKDIYDNFSSAGNAVDTAMSDTSKNPVENHVIKKYVDSQNDSNLLIASNVNITTSNYRIATFGFAQEPENGETVTVLLKGTLGSDRTAFKAYMGGHITEATLTSVGNGYYVATFHWISGTAADKVFNIYHTPSYGTSTSTIEWIKLVRGIATSKAWSDGIPSKYSSEEMQGTGWRRIAKYNTRGGVGILSGSFAVTVGRNYSGNNNEVHKVQIVYTYNQSFKIVNILDKSNSRILTKIRVVYDSNTQMNYLELYYNSAAVNLVYTKIEEGEIPTHGCWVAVTPELVSDESSLSVKAEAELPANFQVGGSEIDASAIKSGVLARERIPKIYKEIFSGNVVLTSTNNYIQITGEDLTKYQKILIYLDIHSSSSASIADDMPIYITLQDGYWNFQNIPILWKMSYPYESLALTGIQAAYGGNRIDFNNVNGSGFNYQQLAEDTFLFSQKKTFAEASSLELRFEIQNIYGVY